MGNPRKRVALSVLLLVLASSAAFGYHQWRHHQRFAETEDAYVGGSIYTIASRIPGTLVTFEVTENQEARAGQVLATLDARDYDAAVAKAEASLAEATAGLAKDEAGVEQARAQLETARSQLNLAQIEKERADILYRQRSLPKQDYDHAITAEQVAQARFTAAQKAVNAALAELEVSKRKVEVASASLETARLQRSYCTVTAPVDGVVSRKMAEIGDVTAAGQPLCAVVPLDLEELWIEANYKETQLRDIRPGQIATVRADIDKRHEYRGIVESLSPGTGAAFSLLPPENATGNWVKIVQRVPVRIRIDPENNPENDPDHRLRLGLSVRVSIDTHSQ